MKSQVPLEILLQLILFLVQPVFCAVLFISLSLFLEANLGLLESTGFMKKFGDLLYLTCDDAVHQAVTAPGPARDIV